MESAQRSRMAHDGCVETVEAVQPLRNFLADGKNAPRSLQCRRVERVDQSPLSDNFEGSASEKRIRTYRKIHDIVCIR